jgi:hypothetical protein
MKHGADDFKAAKMAAMYGAYRLSAAQAAATAGGSLGDDLLLAVHAAKDMMAGE